MEHERSYWLRIDRDRGKGEIVSVRKVLDRELDVGGIWMREYRRIVRYMGGKLV